MAALASLTVAVGFSGGCTSAPIELDAPAIRRDMLTEHHLGDCGLAFGAIRDQTSGRTVDGHYGGRPVSIQDVVPALEEGFEAIGLRRAPSASADVDIVLARAYVSSKATSKFVNVVLIGALADGTSVTARGTEASTNWFGTKAEIAGALDRAVTRAVAELASRLRTACP